jgi:hypothetical protein
MANLPASLPQLPAGVTGHMNYGQVCLEIFTNVIESAPNFNQIRQTQGGGWEGWLEVEFSQLVPGRPQLANHQIQVQRQQKIYRNKGQSVDLWIIDHTNHKFAGLELKCQLLNEPESDFILRFTEDYGSKIHDGPDGGPDDQYRRGQTVLWGLGFVDALTTVRRILGQMSLMTFQPYFKMGYAPAGKMYLIWYCQCYA